MTDINITSDLIVATAREDEPLIGDVIGRIEFLDSNKGPSVNAGAGGSYAGDWILTIDPISWPYNSTDKFRQLRGAFPDPQNPGLIYYVAFWAYNNSYSLDPPYVIDVIQSGFVFDTRTAYTDYSWLGGWDMEVYDLSSNTWISDYPFVVINSLPAIGGGSQYVFPYVLAPSDSSASTWWSPVTPSATNDNWADAEEIFGSSGYLYVSNAGTTLESGEPGDGQSSVWYKWTAPSSELINFNTYGSIAHGVGPVDSKIFIYTGSALNSLTLIANNDDHTGSFTYENVYESEVEFNANSGTTYYIQLEGYWEGAIHEFKLNWSPAPVNINVNADTSLANVDFLDLEYVLPQTIFAAGSAFPATTSISSIITPPVITVTVTFLIPTVDTCIIFAQIAWAFAADFLDPEVNQIIPNLITASGQMDAPTITAEVTDSSGGPDVTSSPPVATATAQALAPVFTLEQDVKNWWVAS